MKYFWFLFMIGLTLLVGGCASQRSFERYDERRFAESNDSVRVREIQKEFVLMRDTVSVEKIVKGDSVWVAIYKEKWRVRDVAVHDTITKTKTKTITITKTIAITKTIVKTVAWWKRVLMWFGGIEVAAIAIFALFLGVRVVKRFKS